MARLPKIVVPLHIVHRSNNKQDIFESEEAMIRTKEDIEVTLLTSNCALSIYVIMTNHLHLLITPPNQAQLAVIMQSMTNKYLDTLMQNIDEQAPSAQGGINHVESIASYYLFALYQYIKMNPIKAVMLVTLQRFHGHKLSSQCVRPNSQFNHRASTI